METVNERFNKIKAACGISNKMLADKSGLSLQSVINQCGGKYSISIELLSAILTLAPSCDARWLITGEQNALEERVASLEIKLSELSRKILDLENNTTPTDRGKRNRPSLENL